MNKQEIEKAINGLKQLKPILQARLLKTNYEGLGTEDAKELGEHFNTAIQCMQQQLTNGWILVYEKLPDSNGKYKVIMFDDWTKRAFETEIEYTDAFMTGKDSYVIAWQPLPEPYKEVSNDRSN